MAERMTLTSASGRALLAFGCVMLLATSVWLLKIIAAGDLLENSFGFRFVGGVMAAGMLYLAVRAALRLAERVVVGPEGIHVIGAFRRRHLPWDEVTGVELHRRPRFWDVVVRTPAGEEILHSVPAEPFPTLRNERYAVAPPSAPKHLRIQYGFLRDTWERHRAAPGA
ncbi:PH domain-containing protein [Actinomadura parmotrematis]|uniref:PH domain-containing protein n=1 Tax=Actinomadura parmotrematis TaxID=2864039 RepID=A0ABS7G3H1_9ACTN|nr:PH domain-containing protein [Actinomadura parmotrematis]MBW8486203.1 PH domain-containing protein [Actinomadura parmotrematis]